MLLLEHRRDGPAISAGASGWPGVGARRDPKPPQTLKGGARPVSELRAEPIAVSAVALEGSFEEPEQMLSLAGCRVAPGQAAECFLQS
jgi:hypothetical protein